MQHQTNKIALLSFAFLVFTVNCIAFSKFFNADRQGYIDTQRGIDQYNKLRQHAGLQGDLNVNDLPVIRFSQVFVTSVVLIALVFSNATSLDAMTLYLVWPYSAFLATKIKQEFILFPLAFISLRDTLRGELIVAGGIGLASYLAGENNGIIIVIFRLLAFGLVRMSRDTAFLLTVAGIASAVLADWYFESVIGLLEPIAKYAHTRDTVNPEYSIVESAGVLLTTMHLGINPPTDYIFHLPFSACALLLAGLGFRDLDESEKTVCLQSLMAFTIVFLTFTSVTHAFQNTRYYYFLLPVIFPRFGSRLFIGLLSISVLHTLTAVYVYEWLR